MCGICGYFNFDDRELLLEMTHIISHRGPNHRAIYADRDIGLGHARLAIIDKSQNANQPMHNEDSTLWLAANGEIYNFIEIRDYLEKKGHKFISNSDSEVIIHLYEEEGEDFISKLNGMFAFALYDGKKKTLMLGRDRLGEKPLYYWNKHHLIFSSELKAILLDPYVKREIDMQALHDYLSYRYVPEPATLLKDIYKIPAGCIAIVHKNDFVIKRYWNNEFDEMYQDEKFLEKKLDRLLNESVKKKLYSDVPLGLFLSGGVDSALVLAMMRNISKKNNDSGRMEKICTFSIGYSLKGFIDETLLAKATAKHFNTDHHEYFIDDSAFDSLPSICWHLDEPVSDPATMPYYFLSMKAKKHVSVAIVGEGADEQFGGYEQYNIINKSKKILKLPKAFVNRIPSILNATPMPVLDKFFKYSSSLGKEGKARMSAYFSNLGNLADDYASINFIFTDREKQELYALKKKPWQKESTRLLRQYLVSYKEGSILNQMLCCDQNIYLPQLLLKTDKMSMASALEVRSPYLDHRIVDFSSKLSAGLKLRGNTDKYILRKIALKYLPKDIARRKKQRFFVPIHEWLDERMSDYKSTVFSKQAVNERKLFEYSSVKKILDSYDKSKLYYGRQLFSLLMLEGWMKTFIDREDISSPLRNKMF